jgi:hypothetical protein
MKREPNPISMQRISAFRLDPALHVYNVFRMAELLHAGCHDESVTLMKRKRVLLTPKNGNRLGEGWRVRAKPETSVILDAESDRRHKGQGEFWVGALAIAGTISASKLGVALYSRIVRLLN